MKPGKISLLSIILFFIFAGGAFSQTQNYDQLFANIENTQKHGILELAKLDSNFSTFVELVEQADFKTTVKLADSYTLLLPTNEAFDDMTKGEFEELKDPQNKAKLIQFLKRHFLPGKVALRDFNNMQVVETEEEEEARISTEMNGNVVHVGGARIVKPNLYTADGIIHVVDGIVRPTEDVIPD